MPLWAATLRIIGTSEAEANAQLQFLQDEVMRTIGFPSTDGTIQLSVEEVTGHKLVTAKITYLPWSDRCRTPEFNVTRN